MKFFEAVAGSSELVLRLPNILAHVLFLLFTFKLLNRYCRKHFVLFFILLNSNPYLLDFFSLARGYGIAIGLMSAGIYFYSRYIEDRRQKHHVLALAFIFFASLANFALINVFLIVIVIHNLFEFILNKKKITLKDTWQSNRINLMGLVIFAMVVYEPIRKILKGHLVYVGGKDGFWTDTVMSLLNAFAYDVSYEKIIFFTGKIIIITFSILFIIRSIGYFSSRGSISVTQKICLFLGLNVFFIVTGSMIQHWLFKTPYVTGRFALFIYPLFILMIAFLSTDLWNSAFRNMLRVTLYAVTIFYFLHACYTLNTSWYLDWKYDMNTKEMLSDLRSISQKEPMVSLGNTWIFESTINFYRKTLKLDWLAAVHRGGLKPENDYYYILYDEVNTLELNEMELIQCYIPTNNCLVRHVKKIE